MGGKRSFYPQLIFRAISFYSIWYSTVVLVIHCVSSTRPRLCIKRKKKGRITRGVAETGLRLGKRRKPWLALSASLRSKKPTDVYISPARHLVSARQSNCVCMPSSTYTARRRPSISFHLFNSARSSSSSTAMVTHNEGTESHDQYRASACRFIYIYMPIIRIEPSIEATTAL